MRVLTPYGDVEMDVTYSPRGRIMTAQELRRLIEIAKACYESPHIIAYIKSIVPNFEDFMLWAFDDVHETDIRTLKQLWNKKHGHKFYLPQSRSFLESLDEVFFLYFKL